jgi:hypothetical protein
MIFFYGKKTREVGCSYYLLASSCVPVVVIIIFASKFFILIAIQMSSITKHDYFKSIEFLLIDLVNTRGRLKVLIDVERDIVAMNDKKPKNLKNKRISNDEEEKRTLYMAQFIPFVQLFDSTILILHFLLPFLLNIISVLIIIVNITRHRFTVQKHHFLFY